MDYKHSKTGEILIFFVLPKRIRPSMSVKSLFFFIKEKEPKNQDKTKLLPAFLPHPRRFVRPARISVVILSSQFKPDGLNLFYAIELGLFDFHLFCFSLG
jgi:hypothetical protein